MNKMEKVSEDRFEENYILFLAPDVLVVANVNKKLKDERFAEWCAYIGAVKDKEDWLKIRRNGSKLARNVADVLFPFSKTHGWR
jgi:hypothetical protein